MIRGSVGVGTGSDFGNPANRVRVRPSADGVGSCCSGLAIAPPLGAVSTESESRLARPSATVETTRTVLAPGRSETTSVWVPQPVHAPVDGNGSVAGLAPLTSTTAGRAAGTPIAYR